jgi:hypothetical protein
MRLQDFVLASVPWLILMIFFFSSLFSLSSSNSSSENQKRKMLPQKLPQAPLT